MNSHHRDSYRDAVSESPAALMEEAPSEVTKVDLLSRGHHGEASRRNEQNKKRVIV